MEWISGVKIEFYYIKYIFIMWTEAFEKKCFHFTLEPEPKIFKKRSIDAPENMISFCKPKSLKCALEATAKL